MALSQWKSYRLFDKPKEQNATCAPNPFLNSQLPLLKLCIKNLVVEYSLLAHLLADDKVYDRL